MDKKYNKKCKSLFKEYEPSLRKICEVKMQGYEDEIDDIISETFLVLCKQADMGDMPSNPKAWLYATLYNLISQKYREIYKNKEKQVYIVDIPVELPFEDNLLEEKFERIYNEQIKNKLKDFLSEDEYKIIHYIYFDRLKMKEIAVLVGSNESAIKQKHYRICNKLRKAAKKIEKNF